MVITTNLIALGLTAVLSPAIVGTVAKATGFTKAIKKQPIVQDIDESEIEPIDLDDEDFEDFEDEETVDPSI